MIKVQEIIFNDKVRYMVINEDGDPIVPVVKYLKYLDNTGKKENTLKSYCYHLKLYFEYLNQKKIDFTVVNLDVLAEFIGWLRIAQQSLKVTHIKKVQAKRSERTINTILTCVIGFYDYLLRVESYEKDISVQFKT